MNTKTRLLSRLATLLVIALAIAAPASAATLPSTAGGVVSSNNILARPTSGAPKAWIMVIHGGGWMGGKALMDNDLSIASGFNAEGYGTYLIDYRSGYASYADTVAAYDWLVNHLRAQYGTAPIPPICAWGESAGGHLSMLLAAIRPLNCVISQAGPTNFPTFLTESLTAHLLWEPYGWNTMVIPTWTSSITALTGASPASYCPMRTRFLLGASSNDPLVPNAQMNDFKAKCTAATTVVLDGNPKDGTLVKWTHAGVTTAAAAAWQADEKAFLPS